MDPNPPDTRDGFLRAELAKAGDLITLPGRPSATITHVEKGVDLNLRRVIIIDTESGAHTYSPRACLPITPA